MDSARMIGVFWLVAGLGCRGLWPPAPAPVEGTLPVVVAVHDLYMGLPIGPEDVVVRRLPQAVAPAEDSFGALADVVGRTPRERILADEPIREARLAKVEAASGLNAIIHPGKRAMTLELDGVSLVEPGQYLELTILGGPDCAFVGQTLQGIPVLAVDGALYAGPSAPPSRGSKASAASPDHRLVTVEVGPDEAVRLAAAATYGRIVPQVRSDIDILQFRVPQGQPPPCFPNPPLPEPEPEPEPDAAAGEVAPLP